MAHTQDIVKNKRDRVRERGDKKMGYHSLLKISPKKEEEQVPDNGEDIDIMDELEGIWGVDEDEEKLAKDGRHGGQFGWDFMEWEGGFGNGEQEEEDEEEGHGYIMAATRNFLAEENNSHHHHEHEHDHVVKKENLGFWDGCDEKRVSLNLSLNYQEVLDAWSDRGPLWADDYSHLSNSMASNNGYYMGEVPVMELEEARRREASVLRYKEKRQSRLFSKKIRYQVRKLNAEKRPRVKGRFVKRVS